MAVTDETDSRTQRTNYKPSTYISYMLYVRSQLDHQFIQNALLDLVRSLDLSPHVSIRHAMDGVVKGQCLCEACAA